MNWDLQKKYEKLDQGITCNCLTVLGKNKIYLKKILSNEAFFTLRLEKSTYLRCYIRHWMCPISPIYFIYVVYDDDVKWITLYMMYRPPSWNPAVFVCTSYLIFYPSLFTLLVLHQTIHMLWPRLTGGTYNRSTGSLGSLLTVISS